MINGSEPFEGKTENVHQVIPAFYAQHQLEALNLGNDLITELAHFAPDKKAVSYTHLTLPTSDLV